jgi:hypothetical protein
MSTMRRYSIVFALAVTGAAFALIVAGCGGTSGAPGVASIASSTTTGTSTTQSPGAGTRALGGAPSGPNAHFEIAMNAGSAALGAKFSSCMRKHGVTNFPDPNSQGVIQFGSDLGIDPKSPKFRSAQSVCQKLLPNGGQPTPQQQAKMQQQLLAFSKCMRAHGLKDFPDPTNGGLRLRSGQGDLDPGSTLFQSAQQACQGKLPFKAGAGGK